MYWGRTVAEGVLCRRPREKGPSGSVLLCARRRASGRKVGGRV